MKSEIASTIDKIEIFEVLVPGIGLDGRYWFCPFLACMHLAFELVICYTSRVANQIWFGLGF